MIVISGRFFDVKKEDYNHLGNDVDVGSSIARFISRLL